MRLRVQGRPGDLRLLVAWRRWGPSQPSTLNRYFQAAGAAEVGKGRASCRPAAPVLAARHGGRARHQCRRPARALAQRRVHLCRRPHLAGAAAGRRCTSIMQRPTAESRLLLDRIERFTDDADADERKQPEVAQALARHCERHRLARPLSRLRPRRRPAPDARPHGRKSRTSSAGCRRTSGARNSSADVRRLLERKDVGAPEVDLACTLNAKGEFDSRRVRLQDVRRRGRRGAMRRSWPAWAATGARERVLRRAGQRRRCRRAHRAGVPPPPPDRRRRRAARRDQGHRGHERARGAGARTRRAGPHYLSDGDSVDTLRQLFARTRSWPVQNAIAGVLIRADPTAVGSTRPAAHPARIPPASVARRQHGGRADPAIAGSVLSLRADCGRAA